jgi:hypothetical protein
MYVGVGLKGDVDAVDADELTAQVVEEDYHHQCDGAPLQPWASEQDAGGDSIMLSYRWWGGGR